MSELKVGDRLYTVYEDQYGKRPLLVIKAAQITSIGPKRVCISGVDGARVGLAFGCRSQFTLEQIERLGYGRTEREAWEKYAARTERAITQAESELVTLRRQYHHAVEEAKR